MGDERDRLVGYGSRMVSGLVACAVAAATLRAYVAAAVLLVTVMLVVVAIACLMVRDRAL